jgi:hypothetical protein
VPMATKSCQLAALSGLAALLNLAACGGRTPTAADTSDEWPVRISGSGSTCGNDSAIYFISGLSSRVELSAAPPLEARVRVGETIKVQVNYQGCGFTADETWSTTGAMVATVEKEMQNGARADLRALSPGQVSLFVEFRAPDGRRHRTTTGYCDLDAQYPGLPGLGVCGGHRKIESIRVVP